MRRPERPQLLEFLPLALSPATDVVGVAGTALRLPDARGSAAAGMAQAALRVRESVTSHGTTSIVHEIKSRKREADVSQFTTRSAVLVAVVVQRREAISVVGC